MSLFDMTGEQITVPPSLSHIKEFKDIIEHEKGQQYLCYVYHVCDWKSNYSQYPEDKRKEILSKDYLEGKKPNNLVQDAVERYKELNQTDSLLLLESARKAVQKLRRYFDEADPSMEEDPGKSAKDLMQNLKSVGAIIDSLKKWEEQILKEKDDSKVRKGVEINEFNKG